MAKSFQLKLKKSTIGCTQKQKDAVRCLGLRKLNSTAEVADNPAMRGQIRKVQHMLEVTPVK
jgi:large subunit ribosomal protein L30